MNPSKFLSVNEMDAIKSAITAAIGVAFTTGGETIYTILNAGRLPTIIELKQAALVGLVAGFASITRRFFSGEKK